MGGGFAPTGKSGGAIASLCFQIADLLEEVGIALLRFSRFEQLPERSLRIVQF